MAAAYMLETIVHPQRKLRAREEVEKLAELFPGERYELIEGELINKMGQNPLHANLIAALNEMPSASFPGRVRIQSTITLPDPRGPALRARAERRGDTQERSGVLQLVRLT